MRTFLTYLFSMISLSVVLTSCTSSSTVNILILNNGEQTLTNKTVEVPVVEARQCWVQHRVIVCICLMRRTNP